MIIGVTGGIGSGKSTVINYFKTWDDIVIYEADLEAKKLMHTSSEIRSKLKAKFGANAYIDGNLNRSFISKIVFSNPKRLNDLNAIVHPVVKNHFKSFINDHKDKDFIIYENAILFESGSYLICDKIICVYADLETRISRVQQRDQCSRNEVLQRVKNQSSEIKKKLQSHYLINNNNLESTALQIQDIYKKLTKKLQLI